MSGESNADVYAQFGVNSAVMTGSSQAEHEENMLALDVAARDGDDAIELVEEEVDLYGNPDKFADPNEDNGFMQVRIGEDGEVTEGEPADGEDSGEQTEGEEPLEQLGEVPAELSASVDQLGQHEEGFQAMVDQAAERGLSVDSIERIQAEYEGDGISDKSYQELEAAGYSRAFVESYIAGQEALVDGYVAGVVAYAGGQERFNAIHSHLEANNPEAAQSLEDAMGNRDIATIKTIINLASQSFNSKFGKPATRSVTKRAMPAKAAPVKAEGFTSRDEMIKAMSDPRYRSDSSYRRSVEQKVIDSTF